MRWSPETRPVRAGRPASRASRRTTPPIRRRTGSPPTTPTAWRYRHAVGVVGGDPVLLRMGGVVLRDARDAGRPARTGLVSGDQRIAVRQEDEPVGHDQPARPRAP